MAGSETEICNSALVKLGAERITALTDDTKEARLCTEQYPKVRDAFLRSHPWNFAIKRVEIAALATAPVALSSESDDDFTYQFQLPSDCLRVLSTDVAFPENWQVEGDKLLAFTDTVKIRYIAKITDVSKFDACFSEALATQLAADLSYALVQSASLTQTLVELAEKKTREARSYDAQEGRVKQVKSTEWFNARY